MSESTTTTDLDGVQYATPPTAQKASSAGTRRFAARHEGAFVADHFRSTSAGLIVSSLGVGTYLGADSDRDDAAYASTVRRALAAGLNVIDTAVNYRCQRSERAIGRALLNATTSGEVGRDEILVCTKGGYIPLDLSPPNTAEGYKGYLRREFFSRRIIEPGDIVAGGHCLVPAFIEDCIARSRRNLGLETIDLYYVHNPEQQLAAVSYAELLDRLRAVFELLESKVADGEIGAYGCATWQGLRAPLGDRHHIALRDVVRLAREVGGENHGFAAVQLPLNLAMGEGLRLANQPLGEHDAPVTALDAARELGLSVFTSAPLMQGQLTRDLPASLQDALPGWQSDAQRALSFVRTSPGVTTSLVGMRDPEHLEDNLQVAARRG
jgi:aryl-alcohol dehydrogenase-like predicted oxidoreductase